MAAEPKIYRRLARSSASIGSYKSLWLAADHLLIVTSTGYTENYVRIRFRDLKGIFVTGSDRLFWWNVVWILFAVIAAFPLIASIFSEQVSVTGLVILGVAVVGLVGNYLLGPSSAVFVVTGVQTARLPSLVRRRKHSGLCGS